MQGPARSQTTRALRTPARGGIAFGPHGPRSGIRWALRLAQCAACSVVSAAILASQAVASPADYTFVVIASEDDPGFVAGGFLDLALNNLGQVAHTRAPNVQNPTFAHGGAVVIGDGVTSRTIVDGSTPVPAGNFFRTFLNLGDPGSAKFSGVDLNDSGQVVFRADLNDRVSPPRVGDTGVGIFATDIDGNLVEIGTGDNDCCGAEPEFAEVGGAAINNRGAVVFGAREQTPSDPGFESVLILTRTTRDPVGSSMVALRDFDDSVFDPDVHRQVGTQIRLEMVPEVDDAGSVATTGDFTFTPAIGPLTFGKAILAGPADPPSTVVVGDGTVNEFSLVAAAQPSLDGTGRIGFLARPSGGNESLFDVDRMGGAPALLLAAVNPIDQVIDHDTNDAGAFAVTLLFDGYSSTGVFTGPDLELDRVLATGDTLFGRPVRFVEQGEINDLGQIAFRVTFADDSSNAIVRADPLGSSGGSPCPPSLPRPLAAPCLPAVAAELAAGSPVTIARSAPLDGDETAVGFALRFLTPDGDLTVTLDGATSATISADEQNVDEFVQRVVHLPLPISGARELSFTFDGPPGSAAQIADIELLIGAVGDPVAGGTFADGGGQPFASLADAGWSVSGSGTATVQAVPEPDASLLAAAALSTLIGVARRRGRSSKGST